MKKILLLLLAILPALSFGQTEKETSKKIAAQFETLYNAGNYTQIFDMFAGDMKAALPKAQTIDFLTGVKTQAGNIVSREFTGYENGSYAAYKTKFERTLFAVNISVDANSKINGLFIKPFLESNLPKLERNQTKLMLPFKGEWTVVWGGDTKALNYHVENQAQKNAFDFLITDKAGKSYKTDGKTNEDYYAFGQELIAPCEAEVVLVVDGIKDNIPGEMNPAFVTGNTVVLKTDKGEYMYFAHFKQHSIVVKQGQKVKQGQLLGLSGNSGNSSEAHLHFHMQNIENLPKATGAKSYFNSIYVNGALKEDHSPLKTERIRNK